jgi:hypothetical protein
MYKLNIDDLDGGDEDAVTGMRTNKERASHLETSPPCRLPDPVLRLGYSSIGSWGHFHALGSKIIATGRARHSSSAVTFVYDTKTGRLDAEQPPPEDFSYWHYQAAAAGNKLYTISSGKNPHYSTSQTSPKGNTHPSHSPRRGGRCAGRSSRSSRTSQPRRSSTLVVAG